MVALVEVRRQPAGQRDVLWRRVDQIIWQARFLIGGGRPIEIKPARVMVRDDMDHQVKGREGLELDVAKRPCELLTQRGMLPHHNGQPGRGSRGGLYNHDMSSPLT